MTAPPLKGTHEALTFAFRFASQQWPRTPMSGLLQGGRIGSGAGLVGLDGAGQAGMLLAVVGRLPPMQAAVVVARYGDIRQPCPCCGADVPPAAWKQAIDALSFTEDLADLPRQIRHAAVEKIVCRRRHISMTHWANQYTLNARTVRQRVATAKQQLAGIESAAIAWLTDYLQARGVIAPPG